MAALNQCIFSKKSGCQSSAGAEILTYISHCSAQFQLIFDCFMPNLKLKYKDPENIKTDCVNTVVLNLHQITRRAFFGTPGIFMYMCLSRPQQPKEDFSKEDSMDPASCARSHRDSYTKAHRMMNRMLSSGTLVKTPY